MRAAEFQSHRVQQRIKLRVQLGELAGIYFPCCIECVHFDEKREVCTKYGNQRPPARTIAYGCEGYDEIPF